MLVGYDKIVFAAGGLRYYLGGREVTREEFDAAYPSKLAPMLQEGRPPLSNTDREFLQGHCNGSQFEKTPHVGDYYARAARAAGVDPKGKVYLSGLAAFPGDPRAWVDGRGDVERLAQERGLDVEGSVNIKAMRRDCPPPEVALADDIVDDRVAEVLASVPEPQRVDVEDLREQVKEKHSPHWAR